MRSFLLSIRASFQICFIVGLTIALAFIIALTFSTFFDTHQLQTNTDLISSVYQVLGTVYAILLTFTFVGCLAKFQCRGFVCAERGIRITRFGQHN